MQYPYFANQSQIVSEDALLIIIFGLAVAKLRQVQSHFSIPVLNFLDKNRLPPNYTIH